MSDPPLAVIALGDSTLDRDGDDWTYDHLYARALVLVESLRWMIDGGWRLVLVPGNGAQLGQLSAQQESTAAGPAQPLPALEAMTQGLLGSVLALALEEVCGDQIGGTAVVVTHTEVDPDDPAFAAPTRVIGPSYSSAEAALFRVSRGWTTVEDDNGDHRRTVPSPRPQHFLEAATISALAETGSVVIAAGGGGIPVVRREPGWRGVQAAVDEDQAAARLAEIIGAQVLIVLSSSPNVCIDHGRSSQRPITEMTVTQARGHLAAGQFTAARLASRVEALGQFVERSRGVAAITNPELLRSTLDTGADRTVGERGTLIVPEDWRLAGPRDRPDRPHPVRSPDEPS